MHIKHAKFITSRERVSQTVKVPHKHVNMHNKHAKSITSRERVSQARKVHHKQVNFVTKCLTSYPKNGTTGDYVEYCM